MQAQLKRLRLCLLCVSSLMLSDDRLVLQHFQPQEPRHWCSHEFHRALGALLTSNPDAWP
ncbi:hypothetical protein D9M71_120110 [compost metagenome]